MIELYQGDCIPIMGTLPGPYDLILADLPYGTTACKWDTVIPFGPLWAEYKRLIKKRGAVVLFGSQPFTSALVMSNVKWFKYCWVWHKNLAGNFAVVAHMPLSVCEDVLVFSDGAHQYNPQMRTGKARWKGGTASGSQGGAGFGGIELTRTYSDQYHPRTSLDFRVVTRKTSVHESQKPVPLLEYLIRTYTNPGETVLDNTMGSGSTGVACVNTGRGFAGIEKDAGYFAIAQERITAAQAEHVQAELF